MKRRNFFQTVAVASFAPLLGTALTGCESSATAPVAGTFGVQSGSDRIAYGLDGRALSIDASGGVVHVVGSGSGSGSGTGAMLGDMSPYAHPIAAAGCRSGSTAVVDASADKVVFYDSHGRIVTRVGRPELASPTDVAFSRDGRAYVSDSGTHEIVVLDGHGVVLQRFGGLGTDGGLLNGPNSVALGPDGLTYVSEGGNARVSFFASDGSFRGSIGSYGRGAGQFLAPRAVRLDGSGRVYVADAIRGDVQVFADGTVVDCITPESGVPLALSALPDGGIYVTVG